MRIKICPKCGSHNFETASVCAKAGCGQSLSSDNITEINNDIVSFVSTSNEASQSSNSSLLPNQTNTKPSQNSAPFSFKEFNTGCLVTSITVICIGLLIILGLVGGNGQSDLAPVLGGIAITTPFLLLILFLCWAPFGLWLWPLIDCIRNEPSTGNDKIVWILIILFTGFIGGALYLLIRRSQRIATYGH